MNILRALVETTTADVVPALVGASPLLMRRKRRLFSPARPRSKFSSKLGVDNDNDNGRRHVMPLSRYNSSSRAESVSNKKLVTVLTEFGPLYSPVRGSQGQSQRSPELQAFIDLDSKLGGRSDKWDDAVNSALDAAGVDNLTDLMKVDREQVGSLVRFGQSLTPAVESIRESQQKPDDLEKRLAAEGKVIITQEALEVLKSKAQNNNNNLAQSSVPTVSATPTISESAVASMLNIGPVGAMPGAAGAGVDSLTLGAGQPMPEHKHVDATTVCNAFRRLVPI